MNPASLQTACQQAYNGTVNPPGAHHSTPQRVSQEKGRTYCTARGGHRCKSALPEALSKGKFLDPAPGHEAHQNEHSKEISRCAKGFRSTSPINIGLAHLNPK